MYTFATDIVKQRTQLIEGHPAYHHALSVCKNLLVEVVPLRTAPLWLTHTGSPLDSIQLIYLQYRIQMTHGPHPIKMVEGIVYLLTLFTDKRLYKTAVVVNTDHRRDVALQLRHLSRSPRREITEGHLITLTDDIIEFVEHLEIDVVDLLQLVFQHLGLHHGIEQHLVRPLDGSKHIKSFHQVGHTHIIMSLCLLLTCPQQCFMEQVVGVVGVKDDVIFVVGVRMNPDCILAAFEHPAQDGSKRTRSQLGICHGQHISHQRRVCHIPV